jgi:hypothetical protein
VGGEGGREGERESFGWRVRVETLRKDYKLKDRQIERKPEISRVIDS